MPSLLNLFTELREKQQYFHWFLFSSRFLSFIAYINGYTLTFAKHFNKFSNLTHSQMSEIVDLSPNKVQISQLCGINNRSECEKPFEQFYGCRLTFLQWII